LKESQDKSALRSEFLGKRTDLTEADLAARSRAIQKRLMATSEFKKAGTIALYHPIRKEADTGDLFKHASETGRVVLFPMVSDREKRRLVFCRVESESDLRPGNFGIMEPCDEGKTFGVETIDLFVVPGLAFDLKGRRLGYGHGYYDRVLGKRRKGSTAAGLAFDFQVTDRLPANDDDAIMDLVITEKRTITFNRQGA